MPTEKMNKPHVVLVTFSAFGHMNPFMNLAKQLAEMGVSVTVILPMKLPATVVLPSELDIKLIEFTVDPSVTAKQPPRPKTIIMQGIRRGPEHSTFRFPTFEDQLKQALEEMEVRPAAVVVDFLCLWTRKPIDELNIPRYVLYTAPASHLAVGLHLLANPRGFAAVKNEAEKEGVINVEGLSTLKWTEVAKEHRKEDDPFFLGEENAHSLLESRGIFINTNTAVEGKLLDVLRRRYPRADFIPIGPLLSPSLLRDVCESGNTAFIPSNWDLQCKAWLDKQTERSVVFVSFGSWTGIGPQQTLEVALGLEKSGKPFLWVIRNPYPDCTNEHFLSRMLPEGFLERVRDRGFILTDWAPQTLILQHVAIGGFITHCGWNSIVECVALAGVPLVGWPFVADQPVTCRYIVDELRVGLDVNEDENGLADRREVERVVRKLMEGNGEMMKRAQELRARMLEEWESSSCKNLERFVQCLKKYTA